MAVPSGRLSICCTAGEGSIPAHILWFGEKLALCSAQISCHSKVSAPQPQSMATCSRRLTSPCVRKAAGRQRGCLAKRP